MKYANLQMLQIFLNMQMSKWKSIQLAPSLKNPKCRQVVSKPFENGIVKSGGGGTSL